MADQVPLPPKVAPPLALTHVSRRPVGFGGKVRTAMAALRRGDFAGLADGIRVFLRSRLGRLVRRFVPARQTPVQKALLRLAALRPAPVVPSLAELRARVAAFLPAGPGRVSAVVPCFDYGGLVVEAVDSLRRQTYAALEIVVVDDGSTDPVTLAVLREFEAAGDIRVVRQANQGLVAARQAGAAAATGAFLLFLDNDDRITPECVALLMAHLAAHPDRDYAYPAQHFFGDEELVWEPQQYDAWDLLWSNHPTVCALIRRAAFDAVGGYDLRMARGFEDWELWMALAAAGRHGLLVPVPMFDYRRHGHTMSRSLEQRGAELRALLLDKHAESHAPSTASRCKQHWRPSVSVVVPFHDAHRFWPETLASLQAQSLGDFEVVLVNDGSTAPESLRLLEELRRGGEVRVLDHAQCRGAAAARNTGVLAARSEFVFLLDADDLLASTALEQLAWLLLTSPECGFVYPGVVHFGERTGVCLDAYDPQRLRHENYLTCAAMLRRDVYVQVGGMATLPDLHEDWDFWLRLAALGIQGRLLAEPLFFYRRHGLGRSAAVRQQVRDEVMRKRLRQRNPVLFGDAVAHPAHYAPMPVSVPPLDELTQGLRSRYRQDLACRHEGYRRPNVPNPLPAAMWADPRLHVLLLMPPCRRDGGAELVDWLRGLDRQHRRLTVVATAKATGAWVERVAPHVDEVFQLEHVVGHARAALVFLEYVLSSRCIDLVVDSGTAIGRELTALVARHHPDVCTAVWSKALVDAELARLARGCDRQARLRTCQDRLMQGSLALH